MSWGQQTDPITGYHSSQPQRCECHDCTQARWRMSGGGGIAASLSLTAEPIYKVKRGEYINPDYPKEGQPDASKQS